MILLIDIGNTHTHVGLAGAERVERQWEIPTRDWRSGRAMKALRSGVGRRPVTGAVLASVVPAVTPRVRSAVRRGWGVRPLELHAGTLRGLALDYPRPETVGADRLANALAAWHRFGAPVVVVDFGTAVTFDVVDRRGCYVGGVIAPGLAAMTDYLHERTALLPRIRLRPCERVVGRSTEEAMLAGAFFGYPGLVEAILKGIRRELGVRRLPVVATGGYAALMAERVRGIRAVCPDLTLEGLRLTWQAHYGPAK
jgi:type III pantothenate kinase